MKRLATIPIVGFVGSASAEVPEAVSTALTSAAADTLSVATSVLSIIISIYAIKLIRRAL